MGNGGKTWEREQARRRRSEGATLTQIADELGVSKGSVSMWCRDVEFEPTPRLRGHPSQREHPARAVRLRDAEVARDEAETIVGSINERDLLMYGLGLYHGEGAKTQRMVKLTNTSPTLLAVFVTWLRRFFAVDEKRLRVRLHLHDQIDECTAVAFWSHVLGIPADQFHQTHRVVARSAGTKHPNGCASVVYSDAAMHRRVIALITAVSSSVVNPG